VPDGKQIDEELKRIPMVEEHAISGGEPEPVE
jgi:hypothetical protein